MEFHANDEKKVEITTSTGTYARSAIKTHFVALGENYVDLVKQYVAPMYEQGDILSISEKIISLCQNNIVRKEDMKISRLAKFLSRFASTSDAGIGVNNVYKMQFAIDHCGRLKILWAAFCAGVGKLFGKKGVFYDIAGQEVRGLDGFYDHSFEEYGKYGIMLPKNPNGDCNEIYEGAGVACMIVDANDFSVDILGHSDVITLNDTELADLIRDNPAGQSTQLTPFVLIRKIS